MRARRPTALVFLLVGLAGCDAGSGGKAPAPARKAAAPKATPVPAASLAGDASARCEETARVPVKPDAYVPAVLVLVKRDYEETGWRAYRLPHAEAASASEVKALVCVVESRTQVARYTSGAPAYRRDWSLKVRTWPDGGVVDAGRLEGGPPPFLTSGKEPGYGGEPAAEAVAWLVRKDPERPFLSHPQGIAAVAFSPDGQTLAAGQRYQREFDMENGGVTLWDVTRRAGRRSFRDSKFAGDGVDGLAFSGDGRAVITSGGRVVVWNAASGARERSFADDTDSEACVAASPDGRLLAACSGSSVRLWEMASRRELPRVDAPASTRALAFSPDGKLLAVGTSGPLLVWDVAAGKQAFAAAQGGALAVAFSPDGRFLATASHDGVAQVWYAAGGTLARALRGHVGAVRSVAFSPDGQTVATGGEDGAVRLWAAATGDPLATLSGHAGPVSSVAFHPAGALLASGGHDRIVRLWSLPR